MGTVLLIGVDLTEPLPEGWEVVKRIEGLPDWQTILEAITLFAPTFVFMDGDLLFDDALILARLLREQKMPTKVLLLTNRLDAQALKNAALAGIEGILPRSPTPQALRDFLTRRESLLTPYLPKEEQEGAKPQGKLIALSSGRGGVGKTTLLVNLAIALMQETRQPVAVLDLFIGDSLILVNATARMTLSEIPEAVREIDLPLLQSFATCHESGVHFFTWFFSPERNLPEYIDIDRLSDVLRVLREGYAYILMETPVTLYVPDLELLKLADEVIIVAVPWDLVSVRATKALTLGMQRWGVTPKLLLNRVERNSELTPEFVAEQLQLPIWEKIPNNSRLVVRANNTGIPIMLANPDSDIADAIRRAARRLAGLPVEETRRRFGFF
jgi:Flp pilus assembly CpaE family ATPase